MQADVMAGGESQVPGHVAGQVAHLLFRCQQLLLHRPGVGEQGPPRLGQAHLAADPVEQLRPELVLQQGDPFAYRGLGEVEPLGGGGKGAALCHLDEGAKVLGIHNVFFLGMNIIKIINLSNREFKQIIAPSNAPEGRDDPWQDRPCMAFSALRPCRKTWDGA